MRALETRIRASQWAVEIRQVKRELAEADAARARAALDEAQTSRRRAERAVDLAHAEWAHSLQTTHFDPVLAQLWAHELYLREMRLQEEKQIVDEKHSVEGLARTTWMREITQFEHCLASHRVVRRLAARKREDIRLNDLADVTTQRWQNQ